MSYVEDFINDREVLTKQIDSLVNRFLDKHHEFIESEIKITTRPAAYWSVYASVRTKVHTHLIEKIVASETNSL